MQAQIKNILLFIFLLIFSACNPGSGTSSSTTDNGDKNGGAGDSGGNDGGTGTGNTGDDGDTENNGSGNLQLPQNVSIPFNDSTYGSTLVRITDQSKSGGFGTHIYSQLQAFSSDNAFVLLVENDNYVVRNFSDLSLVSGLDTANWNDIRWNPAKAHYLIHFDGNEDNVVRVQETNVETQSTQTIYTFPSQYTHIRVNQSFDELSHDGKWIAGMLTRNDGASVIFSLNIETDTLGAVFSISDLYNSACQPDPQWGAVEPDWVAPSPLGKYLVVQWTRDGTSRCSGLETFNIQTGAFVGRVYESHQHGDLGVDNDGVTEFFMTFELSHPQDNNRSGIGLRLLPGTSTASVPTYLQIIDWNGEHLSCQGPNGMCLVTTSGNPDTLDSLFPSGDLFIQYTDGRVKRFVHHNSTGCGYWVQPRASLSRDGNFAIFASDWGSGLGCSGDGLGQGEAYVVDMDSVY